MVPLKGEFFSNLRTRPEAERRKLVLVYSVVGTIVIFGVWVTLIYQLAQNAKLTEEAQKAEAQALSPLQSMKETVTENIAQVKEGWTLFNEEYKMFWIKNQ